MMAGLPRSRCAVPPHGSAFEGKADVGCAALDVRSWAQKHNFQRRHLELEFRDLVPARRGIGF